MAYAASHLVAVRRAPRMGELTLRCPDTKATWLAREPWADPSGQTTLVQLPSTTEATPD